MRYRCRSTMPERMVVLSLLLPPLPHEPLAPFGFGAFIITTGWRNDAAFASHAHGYGAGHEPRRMREDIGKLLTPDTIALTHTQPPGSRLSEYVAARMTNRLLDFVPKSGLAKNFQLNIPHEEMVHAARLGNIVEVGPAATTPLQRLWHIEREAEAAWLWWLMAVCAPRMRRHLFAGHAAWQKLETARTRFRVES